MMMMILLKVVQKTKFINYGLSSVCLGKCLRLQLVDCTLRVETIEVTIIS